MKFYINDTTINKVVYFDDVNEIVLHLERLCMKKFKQDRKTWMFEMQTLGHGFDDAQGIYFTELMSGYFDVGIYRDDGRHIKTNIHEFKRNLKYRNEMGD
jgi:hypothetical protein